LLTGAAAGPAQFCRARFLAEIGMSTFSWKRVIAALLGAVWLTSVNAALACEGRTVIFEDKFEDDSGGWEANRDMSFGKAGLRQKFTSDDVSSLILNSAFTIKDADICLEAIWPAAATDDSFGFGIMFWASDYSSYFLYQVEQDGILSLHRRISNQWARITGEEVPAVKKNADEANLLRITLRGNLASMYVNGVKYKDQRAQAPTAESRFGIRVGRSKTGTERTFLFKRIKVTTVN
jgi:hypothetical protein